MPATWAMRCNAVHSPAPDVAPDVSAGAKGVAICWFREVEPGQDDAPFTPRTGDKPTACLRPSCVSVLREVLELGLGRSRRPVAAAQTKAQSSGQPLRLAKGACFEPLQLAPEAWLAALHCLLGSVAATTTTTTTTMTTTRTTNKYATTNEKALLQQEGVLPKAEGCSARRCTGKTARAVFVIASTEVPA